VYESHAMGDERRWAARYQFLEELWRERDRIVFDPEIEQALFHGSSGGSSGSDELLGRLLPDAEPDARVWVALANDRRAAAFARARSGTVFVGLDAAAEIATDEAWQVALIQLPPGGGEPPGTELLALLDVLGDKCTDDPERTVVIAVACEPAESEQVYERLAELVEEQFGDARIYGFARPTMVAAYDFGRLFDSADEGEGGGEDVAIEVDTTLGSDPRFELYLAVIGDRVPADGLTFIELPSEDNSPIPNGEPRNPIGAIKAQLAEAQRRGDLQAIERLALLEKLEQAEDRAAGLGDELERLRDPTSPRDRPHADVAHERDDAPRLDAVLAREQTLRWELERVRGELDNLRARPVETLEAEAASLRARLADADTELDQLRAELEARDAALAEEELDEGIGEELDDDDEPDEPSADLAFEVMVKPESSARTRERQRLRGRLDRLLVRLERGADLSALELHRELAALRRSLT
jgi:hypothetical protein